MTTDHRPLVYTAQSKQFFYCRDAVCEFVFREGGIPLNPFRAFDYFLSDRVERDTVRDANRRLIQVSDEVWVFGDTLADGVILEIAMARRLGKPVHYFTIGDRVPEIKPLEASHVEFEQEVLTVTGLDSPRIRDLLVDSADILVSALGRTRELSGS